MKVNVAVLALLLGVFAPAEGQKTGASVTPPQPVPRTLANSLGMEFVWIGPGEFEMGSLPGETERDRDEGPVHRVRLTRGYYLGKHEVTQGQWKALMGNNPSGFSSCGADCPVERVSWHDAHEFIRKLNARERGRLYRLPTEAEWEYAARAGSRGERHGDIDSIAWCYPNSGNKTHPVGKKRPNAWGLHDMIGNVWEWVEDWFDYYGPEPAVDPAGPPTGVNRVNRGGSWNVVSGYCRSAFRAGYGPATRINYLGFRLALNPPLKQE
ncbi:MAG: formylglycine-generating enzyme family protein [Thermoanaerobaculia bacterium]|nr:Serine/threonine-protein kinase pkn1 [Thermoanaerobaculia bacterium]MCK6682101.1 formylglycine-generating enzyme family protein [Thermoanaerobaculia bacterium]